MWILKVPGNPDTLYLMQSNTNEWVNKVNIDTSSFDDLKWFNTVLSTWFKNYKPGTMIVGNTHPQKYEGEPEETKQPPGTNEPFKKPIVEQRRSPNKSSRNGVAIKRIILHYTTSRNVEGSLSWFANPASRVSAHYVIARDGKIYQCVPDDQKAWHAGGANADSIGLEHSAQPGDKLTPAQEEASIALCKWLMAEYKIPLTGVTAHKWVPGNNTSCPGSLWPTLSALEIWKKDNLA